MNVADVSAGPAHVFMTADAVGGVWTYALEVARGLTGAGIAVTIAVLGPRPDAEQRAASRAIEGLSVVETSLPLDWTAADVATLRSSAVAIAALAEASGADLVHLNSPVLAAEADFGLPVVGVCHSCLATWWQAVRGEAMPAAFRWHASVLARGYAACNALIAPTKAFAAATATAYEIARPRAVRNGRTLLPLASAPPRERIVLTAGRLWDGGKNLATLDRAAAILDVPVLAAGPLCSPTGERFAPAHLRSLGHLSGTELTAMMARAAVFASVAHYEPFGLAVLEAAQAGCPLVLSDIPSFRELWEGAALFVPADDPERLAEALRALLDDGTRQRHLGRAARKRAANYGVAQMIAGITEVYRDVLTARADARQVTRSAREFAA